MTRIAFALVAGLALAPAAVAETAEPQIPTFANPEPLNPVATDGSPLSPTIYNGRSAHEDRSAWRAQSTWQAQPSWQANGWNLLGVDFGRRR